MCFVMITRERYSVNDMILVVVVVVVMTEVLRLFKCGEETEENMQGLKVKYKVPWLLVRAAADLNPRFIDGNVKDGTDDVHIRFQTDIESSSGQPSRTEQSVQLLGPLGHQQVNVWHLFGILDGGWRLRPVQIVNVFDPFLHHLVVLSPANVDNFLHFGHSAAGPLAQ